LRHKTKLKFLVVDLLQHYRPL